MTVLATAATSAALASGSNSTSTLNDVEPGLLGFLVVAGMALVLVFLLRSMNKQFRKIGPAPAETEADGGSGSASRRSALRRHVRIGYRDNRGAVSRQSKGSINRAAVRGHRHANREAADGDRGGHRVARCVDH